MRALVTAFAVSQEGRHRLGGRPGSCRQGSLHFVEDIDRRLYVGW